jgi:peptidyl-prolyl cis-trans isomerase B (cyclophilin B)
MALAVARKKRQRLYMILAAIFTLLLVGALALVAIYGSRTSATDPAVVDPGTVTTTGPDDTANAANVPDPALAEGRIWDATISTNIGDITVELDGVAAPQAVANFIYLAQTGFFDSTMCHRLTTAGIFVLQCGDPTALGTGGPDWRFGPIENAPADDMYVAGTLAMARVGGNAYSMGSQFFLVYEDSRIPSDSAGGYTIFGHITSGLDIVQAIADVGVVAGGVDGRPAHDVIIERVVVQ